MNDALGMYLLLKAEHAAVLREFAERERRRGYPRAASTRRRGVPAAARWIRRLRRPGGTRAAGFAS